MKRDTFERLKKLGIAFDEDFENLLVKPLEEQNLKVKNPEIISCKVKETPPFQYGDTINVTIETKDIIGETIQIGIFDNDRVINQNKKKDTLLWIKNVLVSSNSITLNIELTKDMRNLAHKSGEIEFKSAEYYIKVSSKLTNDYYSSEFSVEDKFRVNYFTQQIITPKGDSVKIQDNAVPVLNSKKQTVAFITPEEKLFIWIDEYQWQGYFEDGIKNHNKSYIFYVKDKYEREESPISWGIYLVTADSGEFVLNLLTEPKETLTGLGKVLKKIVTLDFSIAETWDRIQRADVTDATYVVSTILMGYLGSKFGKIPKEDIHKFVEIAEDFIQKGSKKLTWAEVLILFKKAIVFEGKITQELLKKYPIANGYILISRLYLYANNVVSIADNCIFNINTKKWILNETKYGIRNTLSTNQKKIENVIKVDGLLEIRTATGKLPEIITKSPYGIVQGSSIKISEILRSHSMDGKIINETIKKTWP